MKRLLLILLVAISATLLFGCTGSIVGGGGGIWIDVPVSSNCYHGFDQVVFSADANEVLLIQRCSICDVSLYGRPIAEAELDKTVTMHDAFSNGIEHWAYFMPQASGWYLIDSYNISNVTIYDTDFNEKPIRRIINQASFYLEESDIDKYLLISVVVNGYYPGKGTITVSNYDYVPGESELSPLVLDESNNYSAVFEGGEKYFSFTAPDTQRYLIYGENATEAEVEFTAYSYTYYYNVGNLFFFSGVIQRKHFRLFCKI